VMQPVVSEEKQITLVGMSFYGDPFDARAGWDDENEIGHLWKRFMKFLSSHQRETMGKPQIFYEVHIYTAETREIGKFEVFVGVETDLAQLKTLPVELCVKVLPETRYAIFTFHGKEITTDWEKTLQDWLVTSGYESPYSYNFQYYDDRFKGLDRIDESSLDVYVPVVRTA
jgi:predicted transcriptional regulator YdeE